MRLHVQCLHGDTYVPVLFASFRLKASLGVANATPGTASTITIINGSTTIQVITLTSIAVGVDVTGVPDATNGLLKCTDGVLKITCASQNSVSFGVTLDIDEFSRSTN